jgi:hypothetical protein
MWWPTGRRKEDRTMELKTAREIAREWADLAAGHPNEDPYRLYEVDHGHDRAKTAMIRQAAVMIPQGAVAAAVHDNRTNPRVVAVEPEERALYRIDFVPFDEEVDRHNIRDTDIRVTATIIPLDPPRARVEATSYWTKDFVWMRVMRWHFKLGGDDELIFTTEAEAEGPIGQSEVFAHALCSALGAPLPPRATELAQAA